MEICWQRIRGELRGACLLSLALLFTSAAAADHSPETPFVRASGTAFVLDDKPFFVTGVNNHYLTFASQSEVTRVLDDAVAMGANVVRTILQPVTGSRDGRVPTIWNWPNPAADASNLGVRACSTGTRQETRWRSMTDLTACRKWIFSLPKPGSATSS